jgi:hypothetical protein
MSMELRRDWNADGYLAGSSEAGANDDASRPRNETSDSEATKTNAAAGFLTVCWIALLCHLIGTFLGSLF